MTGEHLDRRAGARHGQQMASPPQETPRRHRPVPVSVAPRWRTVTRPEADHLARQNIPPALGLQEMRPHNPGTAGNHGLGARFLVHIVVLLSARGAHPEPDPSQKDGEGKGPCKCMRPLPEGIRDSEFVRLLVVLVLCCN